MNPSLLTASIRPSFGSPQPGFSQPEPRPGALNSLASGSIENVNSVPVSPTTESVAASQPTPSPSLVQWIQQMLTTELGAKVSQVETVVIRLATEVERICQMSQRIQTSGNVEQWARSLAQHRITKYVEYFKLGSRRGRIELHSTLSAIAYRYIAPAKTTLGFEGRRTLLEDFLQGFYMEVLKAFRRENQLPREYTPKTRLELAEYMAFTEQYAKRRITIPGTSQQQILVLRAQTFARRQPAETSIDIEMAMEPAKAEEMDNPYRAQALQQVREQMTSEAIDPSDQVLRDRIIQELIIYLESQEQQDCIDYFVLRLQDLPAGEIDEILNLTARQRDYLQQRFKYHVEKFAQVHQWQLVHQWLGIDLEHNLGLSAEEWVNFIQTLSPLQRQLLLLRREQVQAGELHMDGEALSQVLNCTPKRVYRTWGQILQLAWKYRNQKQE
jgi:hypothetical protein